MPRIGVYICECGPNIGQGLDLTALERFARELDGVVRVGRASVLCSPEGRAHLAEEIAAHRLERVVVAGCSPGEHESTFRRVLERAGLNPFFLQMANLREQCAWVVRRGAVEAAERMVAAAVARVSLHEPLEAARVSVCPDVVVVGAGIAGVQAALTLAGEHRTVHLVERLPCVGGKGPLYEEVFPDMACASCMLDPLLDEVLHHEGVRVHLLSRVERVLGFKGNFTVQIRKRARYVDEEACLGCGACSEACPVRVPDAWNPGPSGRGAVSIPYAGALPHLAVVDPDHCLRWHGEDCRACEEACPFGALRFEDEDRVEEIPAGGLVLATGFDLYDPGRDARWGYGSVADVITSYDLERIMNPSGPTGGRVLRQDGSVPRSVGFVLCVGSGKTGARPGCSGVCCRTSLKAVHLLLERDLAKRVTVFHADLCLPGEAGQALFRDLAGRAEVTFVRTEGPDAARVGPGEDGPIVHGRDATGRDLSRALDLVVLVPVMEGAFGNRDLAEILHLKVGEAGFFDRGGTLLDPTGAGRDGVYVAGCAAGPTDLRGAASGGQAAAGRAGSDLVPGRDLVLDPVCALVDEARCSGCDLCVSICPYDAIEPGAGRAPVTVHRLLCRGCGVCAAGCPAGAMACAHFSSAQIAAEMDAHLSPEENRRGTMCEETD